MSSRAKLYLSKILTVERDLAPQQQAIFQLVLDEQARREKQFEEREAKHLAREKQHEEKYTRLLALVNDLPTRIRLESEIPPQVLLQKPVTFLDALGRVAPMHLDFINSVEVKSTFLGLFYNMLRLYRPFWQCSRLDSNLLDSPRSREWSSY